MRIRFYFMMLLLVVPVSSWAEEKASIKWQSWSPQVFETAKREKRLVLLDLEAIWCHWCHVMDETTYRDPKVIDLINKKYIAVKVDQDSRPDISNRYEDYGWPATVIFNSDSSELVKRSGYINPEIMASLLQAVIDDPTPGPSIQAAAKIVVPDSPFLSKKDRLKLAKLILSHYDYKKGAWKIDHKFMDGPLMEWLLAESDKPSKKSMVIQTMTEQLKLVDPVWGGVYQYSTGSVWTEPHFEKIMSTQAENLRLYASASNILKEPKFLKAANDVNKFLKDFMLSSDGAFYTSQDADLVQGEHGGEYFKLNDAERRKKGIPRIDQHVYARENGWVISALTTLYSATGDEDVLKEATKAAQWINQNRKMKNGGYNHDAKDPVGPYLGDTLSMGQAALNLYRVTAQREYLKTSEEAAQFILSEFGGGDSPGFPTAKKSSSDVFAPAAQADENIAAARFFNLLFHYTGNKSFQSAAEKAMRFLASPQISEKFFSTPGILVADHELTTVPLHVTVIGPKSDSTAQALFQSALRYPVAYKRLEWWDRKEGALPHSDVTFPELPAAAAFACSGDRCSLPAKTPEELLKRIHSMLSE